MEKCVGQLRIRYVVNRAVGRVLSRCYKGVVEAEVGIELLRSDLMEIMPDFIEQIKD